MAGIASIPLILVGAEFMAYGWHRWAAHGFYHIHETHRIHHTQEDDNGDKDFIWIIVFIILMLGPVIYFNIIYHWILWSVVLAIFIVNWYIHRQYHNETSWLLRYEWFEEQKKLHFQHHTNPKSNYGIVTHIADRFFGTFELAK